jgi:hypothetical protein
MHQDAFLGTHLPKELHVVMHLSMSDMSLKCIERRRNLSKLERMYTNRLAICITILTS